MGVIRTAVLLLLLLPAATHAAVTIEERPEWSRHFEAAGTVGTFVLCDDRERCRVHNRARAEVPLLPASTFKVANALIGIETGAVSPEERFPWDGIEREYPQWNRDHDLASAMAASCVPVYQEVARRIGAERMADYLARIGYGNADSGGAIDRFWLDGALRISALEQTRFLHRLAEGSLPVSARAQAAVRDLLTVERSDRQLLRAKTGYASSTSPKLGWWVGWVERGERRWLFALNIDITRPELLAARQSIGRAILAAEGILEAP